MLNCMKQKKIRSTYKNVFHVLFCLEDDILTKLPTVKNLIYERKITATKLKVQL